MRETKNGRILNSTVSILFNYKNYFVEFAGACVVCVCPGAVCGALVGVSVFAGALTSGATGFAVKTTVNNISTTMVMPNVQVAFSIKSLVLCTPNCAEDVPPKVPERPPPLGFWAIIIMINSTQAIIIRIISNVNIVLIFSSIFKTANIIIFIELRTRILNKKRQL